MTTTHDIHATPTADGFYVALCTCGWSDFPRLNWTSAMRDVTYHLHSLGLHPWDCHYCRDERLGIPVRAS